MTTATADSKGRVTLGRDFAGKSVIIDRVDENTLTIRAAVLIPESEAWLYRSPKAIAGVRNGLTQARKRAFVKGPNLSADTDLAERLES